MAVTEIPPKKSQKSNYKSHVFIVIQIQILNVRHRPFRNLSVKHVLRKL